MGIIRGGKRESSPSEFPNTHNIRGDTRKKLEMFLFLCQRDCAFGI